MHHPTRLFGRIAIAATLLIASQASGYLISPRTAVHESMTRLAFACAVRAGDAEPKSCWAAPAKLTIADGPYSLEERAVRWSDDPLRQGDSTLTMVKLGKAIVFDCPDAIKGSDGRDQTIYAAGLVCSSHYGRLQFFHAMASAGDAGRAATLRKIYAWSAFAFDVASGRVAVEQDICKAVTPAYGGNPAYAALADAFEAAPGNSCEPPKGQSGMTVRIFFATNCANFGGSCGVTTSAEGTTTVRRAAVGALMHLVQDSYSQSHVARPIAGKSVPAKGPFTATVACTFPTAYFDYGAQAAYRNHADGDQRPALDASCRAGPVDDPVTASAMIWWKVNHARPTAELLDYLTAHVFGPI